MSKFRVQSDVGDTVELAYDLAGSGKFATLGEVIVRLKADGHRTVMTDLRSTTLRRELRELCLRSST